MVVGSVKVNFSKKIHMKNQLKRKESKEEKSRELQLKPKHQIYTQKKSPFLADSLHTTHKHYCPQRLFRGIGLEGRVFVECEQRVDNSPIGHTFPILWASEA